MYQNVGSLSDLLTTAKNSIVAAINEIVGKLGIDWIVEEGTSGIWTYEKWASGKAKCWGKFTQNVSAYALGAFVVGSTSVSAYPFNFVSAPILTAMVQRVGTGGGYATYDYEKTNYANFIVNGSSQTPVGTALDITAECYATGRWK